MRLYPARYFYEQHPPMAARVSLLKDRIQIQLEARPGEYRELFWNYEQVAREDFMSGSSGRVRTEGVPRQVIEVEDPDFFVELEARLQSREANWYRKTTNRNWMALAKFLALVAILLVAAYIWLVPYLADRMARKVPVSYEENLGNRLFSAMKQEFKIDAGKTMLVNSFFQEMKIVSPYTITITVVDDTVSNAFAMPGGNIVVYSRILEEMKTYPELCALLTHEFSHVNEKHSTRRLFRQAGSALFLSILFSDLGAITGVLVNNADQLKSLHYSRSLEKEADLAGVKLLAERKIDCNGFVNLFGLLERTAGSNSDSEWTSSHPNLDRRIAYVRSNPHFNMLGVKEHPALELLFRKMKAP